MTRAKGLRLGPDLTLAPDFATEGVVVIGVRGSGKSNTMVRWAELCYEHGIAFVAVDPKGDWYGIRSSADGKGPGLSVPVFGGLHGDYPLEAPLGERIADLLVETNLSAVLDVSRMSKTVELPRFLVAFFERLMSRHQESPHVRSVIVDEAHRLIPQKVDGTQARLKEAAASILLEGRSWGLGCWAGTQRPARINKDVLEEVTNAVVHSLGVAATNDRRTVGEWTRHYELSAEIASTLTSLAPGEAWFLSPHLKTVKRIRVDRRTTFDSGATPTVGAAPRKAMTMADIDVEAVRVALAAEIEKAKESDPAELRKRIRDLEKAAAAHVCPAPEAVEPEVIKVPVMTDDHLTRLREDVAALRVCADDLANQWRKMSAEVDARVAALASALTAQPAARPAMARPPAVPRPAPAPAPAPRPSPAPLDGGDGPKLGKAERLVLTALAQYPDGRSKTQTALLAGYVASGGGFKNALGALRSKGMVTGVDWLVATEAGLGALGEWEPLPTGEALVEYWLSHTLLGHAEREILRVLLEAHPEALAKADIAARTESAKGGPYEVSGGGFKNALGKLRSLELVVGSDVVQLSDSLVGE